MEANKNINLTWLCINKYLPKLNTNNIKETLLKSRVTFFNLHHMEKGYFPTILIKLQVENREYTIRKFTEKPRQVYRYRCSYHYIKPHPSTRYRKQSTTTEKTNIENTNYQKMLAEYTLRLELIQEELSKLKNTLHDLVEEKKET